LAVMDVRTSNRTVASVVNLNIVINPNLSKKRGLYHFLPDNHNLLIGNIVVGQFTRQQY
jgi:hypothetical protein